MSHTLQIEYSDDVLLSTGLSRDDFNEEACFLLAAKLYELGSCRRAKPLPCVGRRASSSCIHFPALACP